VAVGLRESYEFCRPSTVWIVCRLTSTVRAISAIGRPPAFICRMIRSFAVDQLLAAESDDEDPITDALATDLALMLME
jgi:hypothetical protein